MDSGPGAHSKSALADLDIQVPISGKPEIGAPSRNDDPLDVSGFMERWSSPTPCRLPARVLIRAP